MKRATVNRREFLGWCATASLGLAGCDRHPREAAAHPGGRALRSDPRFEPDVDLTLTARPGTQLLRPGSPTPVWSYSADLLSGPPGTLEPVPDSYLGPTIRLRTGQQVRIRFRNQLPEPTVLHMHGLHVPEAMDGHPRFMVPSGGTSIYEFEVVNRAGTYWYHPHHHERTGLQVHAGLAGLLLVSDAEEDALGLPSRTDELVCVIQDRTFSSAANEFVYVSGSPMDHMSGFLGRDIVVNGRRDAELELSTRVYRVRLVNGSNARIYKLGWGDRTPVTLIGTDGGLLEQPRTQPYLTLAPGERADVILDLRGREMGSGVVLESHAFDGVDFAMGQGGPMGRGMAGRGRGMGGGAAGAPQNGAPFTIFRGRIVRRESVEFRLPDRLSTFDDSWRHDADDGASPRPFAITMSQMQWRINNRAFDMERAASDETVRLGTKEVWEFSNINSMMRMAHPIHLHGRQFRVLRRTVDPAFAPAWDALHEGFTDAGWKDTVLVMPGERVQILSHFQRYPGLFLYHCHNLEHEDMGMMRNYRVVA